MNKHAVTYARAPGEDRNKDSRKLVVQVAMCREYVQQREYLIIAGLSKDDHYTASPLFELPGLNRALELARNE